MPNHQRPLIAFYSPGQLSSYRQRNETTARRLHVFHGRNVLSSQPVVISFSVAQEMAKSNSVLPVMSLNVAMLCGYGSPAYRHRNVTIAARVYRFSDLGEGKGNEGFFQFDEQAFFPQKIVQIFQ